MTGKRKTGSIGEELAASILQAKGYYILRRNFTCPYGEIDIIAVKNNVPAFIEVKVRSNNRYGEPCETVDIKKQRRIKNAARYFIAQCGRKYEKFDFQVMEITVNHIEDLEF